MVATLNSQDLRALADCGISEDEARRQLSLLTRARVWTRLARPCTTSDGIVRLLESEIPALLELHAQAAAAGRFTKFVPASGAASRMFKGLRGRAEELDRFVEGIDGFAFRDDLDRALRRRGGSLEEALRSSDTKMLLDGLFDGDGLDYGELPKGMVKFHVDDAGGRTAFEEHLVEAADYVRDSGHACRIHFTVAPDQRARFDALLRRVRPRWESELDVRYEVGWSEQRSSTDTLAVEPDGRPARGDGAQLLLRPGGHGALIQNLEATGGDLVFVKNIDNVQPDARRVAASRWKRIIAGYLIRVEQRLLELVAALGRPDSTGSALERAKQFRRDVLGEADVEEYAPAAMIRRLNRPLRVCGVVRNTGEPGGGPFWVTGVDGRVSRQIVEAAQVDPGDAGQQEILRSSTHFNPVDLVCSLRDSNRTPFALESFVDPDTSIVTTKVSGTRELRVLERPGLWNGAMADWHTLFVEVPLETFSPVKTVLDLLRDEHRPPQD